MLVITIIKYDLFAININLLLTVKIIDQTNSIEKRINENNFILLLKNVKIFL